MSYVSGGNVVGRRTPVGAAEKTAHFFRVKTAALTVAACMAAGAGLLLLVPGTH